MKLNYFFLHNLIIYLIQSIMMEKLIFLQNSFCFINQSQKSILIYISVPHLKQFNIILKKWISYLIFHPKYDFVSKEFFLKPFNKFSIHYDNDANIRNHYSSNFNSSKN